MNTVMIESLESRTMFSAGLIANGKPFALATLATPSSPITACNIGSAGDSFIAYVAGNSGFAKGDLVQGTIVDRNGNVVTSAFSVNLPSQTVNKYGSLVSTEDSAGNAVLVYSTLNASNQANLYVARISPAGKVIDSPVPVDSTPGTNQSNPAIAPGPNGAVAVAWQVGTSIFQIWGRVFGTTDGGAFAAKQISPASVNTSGRELLQNPAIAFNPASGTYLAAWNAEELNAKLAYTQVAIDDRAISPTGAIGITPTVDMMSPTATMENSFSAPCFYQTGMSTTPGLAYCVNKFSAGQKFLGSVFTTAALNKDGNVTSAPAGAFSLPSGLEANSIVVNPNDPGSSGRTFFMNAGTYNSGSFSSKGVYDVTFTKAGTMLLGSLNLIGRGTIGPGLSFTGSVCVYSSSTVATTTLYGQPVKVPGTILPAWSVSNATSVGGIIAFTVTLSASAIGTASVNLVVPATAYTDAHIYSLAETGDKAVPVVVTVPLKGNRPKAAGMIILMLTMNTVNTSIGKASATGMIKAIV